MAVASQRTGLSGPTVSAAWKAFREGGWPAVSVKPRGRSKGQANVLGNTAQQVLWELLYSPPSLNALGWNSMSLSNELCERVDLDISQRTIEHWWEAQGLKHEPWGLERFAKKRTQQGRWYRQSVAPALAQLDAKESRWQGGVRRVDHPNMSIYQVYLHGVRGRLWMRCFTRPPTAEDYLAVMRSLAFRAPTVLVFHGAWLSASPEVMTWLAQQTQFWLVPVPVDMSLTA